MNTTFSKLSEQSEAVIDSFLFPCLYVFNAVWKLGWNQNILIESRLHCNDIYGEDFRLLRKRW